MSVGLPVVSVTPLEDLFFTTNNGNSCETNTPRTESEKNETFESESVELQIPSGLSDQDRVSGAATGRECVQIKGTCERQAEHNHINKALGDCIAWGDSPTEDEDRKLIATFKVNQYETEIDISDNERPESREATDVSVGKNFLETGRVITDSPSLQNFIGCANHMPRLNIIRQRKITSEKLNYSRRSKVHKPYVAHDVSTQVGCRKSIGLGESPPWFTCSAPTEERRNLDPVVLLTDIRVQLNESQLDQLEIPAHSDAVTEDGAKILPSNLIPEQMNDKQPSEKDATTNKLDSVDMPTLDKIFQVKNQNTITGIDGFNHQSTKAGTRNQSTHDTVTKKRRCKKIAPASSQLPASNTFQTDADEACFSKYGNFNDMNPSAQGKAIPIANNVKLPQKACKQYRGSKFQHISLKKLEHHVEIVITLEATKVKSSDPNLLKEYNYLFPRTVRELITAFRSCNKDSGCKVLLLSSVGPIFSSGLDPVSLLHWSPAQDSSHDIVALMEELCNVLINFKKPIIAAVQGPAIGFGASLLLHCDSVYASERASLQWPFVHMGLCAYGCTAEILKNTVGWCKAQSLLIEGYIMTAKTARECGIFTEVFPHDSLMRQVMGYCESLYQSPGCSARKMKEALRSHRGKRLMKANSREAASLQQCLMSSRRHKYLRQYIMRHLILQQHH